MDHPADTIVCYAPTMITTSGIWQGDNPLNYSLPVFLLQLMLVVLTTRMMVYILKPLKQPRVVAEILVMTRDYAVLGPEFIDLMVSFLVIVIQGGIILGPSVLGQNETFGNNLFPLRSVMVIETMANVGLLYFLFLLGVQMDIAVIKRTGKKALAIALAGMILPFIIGTGFSVLLHKSNDNINQGTYILFLGVALSVTSFPVLARILAELKLINTELGKLAMSAALINDIFAWVLLAIAVALAENETSSVASFWVVLSSVFFVLVCIFMVRPGISWIIHSTPEGETFSEFHICLILTGVMISGFASNLIGTHSVFGAFVFGLMIPNGPLGVTLIEKLEDFVSGLLLPLYFAISGLRTNAKAIMTLHNWGFFVLVVILAATGKVAGTLIVSLIYQMPIREGVTLGLLMNTKGLVEMIILNVGKDQNVLDELTFATMVIVAVIITGIITPIVTVVYRPARRFAPYKKRTIQKSRLDGELRILVCVHTPRSVPSIINLLEVSNPTKRSPIGIYVLHLVELTGRASAMLIVHNTRKTGRPALNQTQAQSDHIINAFENYEHHSSNISVQPLTVISPYSTMHEDICNLAEDKRAAFIIIPFHKQLTVAGGMEVTNPAFRTVNINVLANAPCSIGILVDRGLNGSTRLLGNQVARHVAVLFFGGPDDREGLAYAWRMSEYPGINLTVMRFVPGDDQADAVSLAGSAFGDPGGDRVLKVTVDNEKDMQLDDEYLTEFRMRTAGVKSVVYIEKVVNNGDETVAAIRSIDTSHDLFIVGRGQGTISPLTAGLMDWSECPELGAIGDLLASPDFGETVSVLVVQQHIGLGQITDVVMAPDSPNHSDHSSLQQRNWRTQQGMP